MSDQPPTTILSRRTLLVSAASGLALAACGGSSDGAGGETPTPEATTPPVASGADNVQAQVLAAAGLESAEVRLAPQLTWGELIVAPDQYLQFVVPDMATDGALVTTPVQLWLVDDTGAVVVGPMESTWYPDDRLPSGGLHSVQVTVDAPGVLDVVVATDDATAAGTAAIQAMNAADSLAPGPGEVIPPMSTPTVDDPQGLEALCTREPPCDLHVMTLADALAAGPTVLSIATPAFCSSAICGPVLDDVLSVADSGAFPDVQFVHVEPFVDAGVTVTPIMEELALPSEPWTFVLAPDGTIVQRFPGPVVPEVLDEILAGMPTT